METTVNAEPMKLRMTIVVVLGVWAVALATSFTFGGLVHVLAVFGVILLALEYIDSRKLGW